jgi:hypothetical protein
MQLFTLLQLAKSPRTIEIIDDDVTMTVGIEMVSEETKEVVVVVVVVDKSTSLETQRGSEVVGAAAAWGYSCRRAPCQVQQA